jgi:hypothetical protein
MLYRSENHHTQICPAGVSSALLAIGGFDNDPITRVSFIIAIAVALFAEACYDVGRIIGRNGSSFLFPPT